MKKIFISILLVTSTIFAKAQDNPLSNNIIADFENFLYVLANDGLYRFDKSTLSAEKIDMQEVPFYVISIAKGKDGLLYVGTHASSDHFVYDGINFQGLNLPISTALSNTCSFAFDNNGGVFIPGNYEFFYKSENEWGKLTNKHQTFNTGSTVLDAAYDSDNNLWLAINILGKGGPAGFIERFDSNATEATTIYSYSDTFDEELRFVSSLTIDSNGLVWFTTTSNGINCHNIATGQLKNYPFETNQIPEKIYIDCGSDKNGYLWFLSADNLVCYNGKKFTSYSNENLQEAKGLCCDDSSVWIYTNTNKLLRFSDETFSTFNLLSASNIEESRIENTSTKTIIRNGCLRIESEIPILSATLCNMNGVVMTTIEVNDKNIAVPIDKLTHGVYLLQIQHNNGVTVKKIII